MCVTAERLVPLSVSIPGEDFSLEMDVTESASHGDVYIIHAIALEQWWFVARIERREEMGELKNLGLNLKNFDTTIFYSTTKNFKPYDPWLVSPNKCLDMRIWFRVSICTIIKFNHVWYE